MVVGSIMYRYSKRRSWVDTKYRRKQKLEEKEKKREEIIWKPERLSKELLKMVLLQTDIDGSY